MPDIIIHLGFPKCASTTLQKVVFENEKGYLGAFRGSNKKQDYSRQFRACTAAGPRQWSNFSQAINWADRIVTENKGDVNRFILSDEMLTNRNKFRNRPVIPFLHKFNNEVWTDGVIKVVVILRNYADRISSSYAQVSHLNPNASQADFEKETKKIQMPDYSKWVAELFEALGRKNVCVLLMEDIGQINFWSQLYEFCEIENSDPESMIDNSTNSKRKGHNTWNIQPFNPGRKGRAFAFHIFDAFWPHHFFSDLRSAFFKFVSKNVKNYYSSKYADANKNRETEIVLTPRLREMIQNRTRESTKRLSTYLERDMHQLGY